MALLFTLTLGLLAFPTLADDGFLRPSWTPAEAWTWFLDLTGFSKIGGATSDPDGTPTPPPAEEGSSADAPGGNEALVEGSWGFVGTGGGSGDSDSVPERSDSEPRGWRRF